MTDITADMTTEQMDFADVVYRNYIIALLWTESCRGMSDRHDHVPADDPYNCDTSLDQLYDEHDLAVQVETESREVVNDFVVANWSDVSGLNPAQVGHDFLLTRNGHGAGFWDRGLGEVGDRLTAMCRPYGEVSAYVGDDGLIRVQ